MRKIVERVIPARLWIFGAAMLLAAPAFGVAQFTYATPQDAAEALVQAARSGDREAMRRVLGPDGEKIANSGDAVADASARDRFVRAYDEKHEIRKNDDGIFVLHIGYDDYPFPLPLEQTGGSWHFDTAAGLEEILNRRIGANELNAIEALRAYVDAQREYAESDHDGKGPQYARKVLSSEGHEDGLYWPTAEGEDESPLGALIAEAQSEGYRKESAAAAPYHGYLFRILTAQGKGAAGGERDYIVGDRMIGGFAMIAVPAEYGLSGVKTFIVNQDGRVFERDLGDETEELARHVETFDPDGHWKSVAAENERQ